MLLPAESIYDGTWASGAPPIELADFELMRYMRWSYRDLRETPVYVLRYCRDLMNARLTAEQEHADRERRRAR